MGRREERGVGMGLWGVKSVVRSRDRSIHRRAVGGKQERWAVAVAWYFVVLLRLKPMFFRTL